MANILFTCYKFCKTTLSNNSFRDQLKATTNEDKNRRTHPVCLSSRPAPPHCAGLESSSSRWTPWSSRCGAWSHTHSPCRPTTKRVACGKTKRTENEVKFCPSPKITPRRLSETNLWVIEHEGSRETLSKLLTVPGHPAANSTSQVSVTVQVTCQHNGEVQATGGNWSFRAADYRYIT